MRGVVQPRLRGRILARDGPFRGRRGVFFVPRMGLLVVLRGGALGEVFVTAYLTGDLRGVPAEWSPMRGSGDSGMVRRASGDLMDAAARRRIGGDIATAAVFAEGFASPLGSGGKMAGQHAALGGGGSGSRDGAFGSKRAPTCSLRHHRVVSCPCARQRCIPRPRPAPTSRRPRGEPSRDVPAILPTV